MEMAGNTVELGECRRLGGVVLDPGLRRSLA